jgi:GT2 family glycosyltransferase
MKRPPEKKQTDRLTEPRQDPDSPPFVSVVVPTIGRDKLLIKTVEGLLASDYPDFEIVVVDQTPKPTGEVGRFMARHKERVRYIRKERPGLPGARNVGVLAARGQVILFVDDDVIPERRLISAHARAYRDKGDTKIGGVAGRVLGPDGAPENIERNPARIAKIGLAGLCIFDHFDSDVRTEAHHVRGCNMSFLRRVILEAGGFDVRFGGSAHLEETDLALRVRKRGYRLLFMPDAALVHLLEPAGGCRPRDAREWFFWYGHNVCLFYLKNFPKAAFPLSCLTFAARLPYWAVKNRRAQIPWWAAEGFLRGIGAYRKPPGDTFPPASHGKASGRRRGEAS